MMKRTTMAKAVAAAVALGYGTAAGAGPKPLSTGALDAVTAGTAGEVQGSGGAVVGNNSSAALSLTGTLSLTSEAQSEANALNLVNSSQSTVANGVNVWDGNVDSAAEASPEFSFDVTQENVIEQEQRRVALLPEYTRSGPNSESEWTEDSSYSNASSLSRSNETRDVQSSEMTRTLESTGSVTTDQVIAGQTVRGGRGIAGAGDLDVDFDGGNVSLGGSASVGEDSFLEGEFELTIELPEFGIDFAGGGCAVQMGSCEGNGTLSETSAESSDNTVIELLERSEESSGTFVGGGSEIERAPFEIRDAQAEYVVVDDSTIDVESNFGIELSAGAQSNVRAMNAVNAAGSAVANAVNVSRTPSLNGSQVLGLTQRNVIGHSR